jgi:hypothetical protein
LRRRSGADPGTIWLWDQALAAGLAAGRAGLGLPGALEADPQLMKRIAGLDAVGQTLSTRG